MADGSGLSCTVAHAARALMASVCRGLDRTSVASSVFPLSYEYTSSLDRARAPGSGSL